MLAGWPHDRDHALHVDGRPALFESDRQHLVHALGHRHGGGQPKDRAFPGGERPFGRDVANGSDVDVFVGAASPDDVDAHRYPGEVAILTANRCFVIGAAVATDPGLLFSGGVSVDQARVPSRNPRVAMSSGASVCKRNSNATGPSTRMSRESSRIRWTWCSTISSMLI